MGAKAKKPEDLATAYARAVTRRRDKIVAGPYVRAACRRHLNDLKARKTTGLVWDLEAARKAIRFFHRVLRLNAGEYEGLPFELFGWQHFVIGSLFGWKRAGGTRRFRTAYIEAGKGCGKSPLCAGIGLYMLMADGEARAEVYAAAHNHDQAKVLFRNAVAMVEQSPDLDDRVVMSGGLEKENIAYPRTKSFFKPISSERQGKGKSGPIPHCGLLDEIHEHSTNAMVEFLDAGVKSRRQPLIIMITNSGADRHTVCFDYHEYSIKVADGSLINDDFFAYVCALDKKDDPLKNEACWIKANPSLPGVPGYEYIRSQVTKAKGLPSKETLVKRLNFCVWTDAADAWLTKSAWDAVQADLDLNDYEGLDCYGGLDLSTHSDLTSLVLAFEVGFRRWDVFSWFWMAGDALLEQEQRDNMAPRYQQWRDAGYLLAPPLAVIDYDHAATLLGEVCGRFNLKGVAYDRYKIKSFLASLSRVGADVPMVPHGQGFYKAEGSELWMPGSIEATEAAMTEGRIRINRNPVLSWNVASTVCQQGTITPDNRYFSKGKSTGHIDGAVALVQAIGLADGGDQLVKIDYKPGQMFGRTA